MCTTESKLIPVKNCETSVKQFSPQWSLLLAKQRYDRGYPKNILKFWPKFAFTSNEISNYLYTAGTPGNLFSQYPTNQSVNQSIHIFCEKVH